MFELMWFTSSINILMNKSGLDQIQQEKIDER
ncbi:hypothetical protein [Klebsiella phage 05F01]|nr:hypothetical protein [Klebsiella phage 05F01]